MIRRNVISIFILALLVTFQFTVISVRFNELTIMNETAKESDTGVLANSSLHASSQLGTGDINSSATPSNRTEVEETTDSTRLFSRNTTPFILHSERMLFSTTTPNAESTTPTHFFSSERKKGIDVLIEVNSYACGKFALCNSSLTEDSFGSLCFICGSCRCDDECSYFGDCCVDKHDNARTTGRSNRTRLPWRCIEGIRKNSASYLMIHSCPPGVSATEEVTVKRCTNANRDNVIEMIPASGRADSVTYRNKFCAHCNNVHNFSLWNLNVRCPLGTISLNSRPQAEIWKDVLTSSECHIATVPPRGITPRWCSYAGVSGCSRHLSNDSNLERLCLQNSGPTVDIGGAVYSNVFCALCNGHEMTKKCRRPNHAIVQPRTLRFGLDTLLDFNPRASDEAGGAGRLHANVSMCSTNEVFDPFTRNCTAMVCPPRWVLDEDGCRALPRSVSGLGYLLLYLLIPSRGLTSTEANTVVNNYLTGVKAWFEEIFVVNTFTGKYRQVVDKSSDGLNSSVVYARVIVKGLLVKVRMMTTSQIGLETMENSLRNSSYPESIYLTNDNVSVDVIRISCEESVLAFIPHGTLEFKWSATDYSRVRCFGSHCATGFVSLFSDLNCPHIEINLTNNAHDYNTVNSLLRIHNQNITLGGSSHVYCRQSLKICASHLGEVQRQLTRHVSPAKPKPQIMGILTVVCISLSLVCLLVTFIVFCFISQLRTVPGTNTMAMVFHLFCAQLTFQTGIEATEDESICTAMGIVIHYLWLTAFSWMAVCAYHMCATFTRLSAVLPTNENNYQLRTLCKYMTICHLFAIVIVLTCLGYNLGSSNLNDTGYGGAPCFLSKPTDIGIFFAGPLGIVLIFNIVCFIKTVVAIGGVPDMKCAKNKANKSHMDVYFRLSVLLGFTWVFGFVAAALQSDIFWYVFVVLNGLQGVFVCVAYCGSRRTLALCRDTLRDRSNLRSALSSQTVSSTARDSSIENAHSNASAPNSTEYQK